MDDKLFMFLRRSLDTHQKMIKILLEHKANDGICYITQKQIAERFNFNQSNTSRYLRRLEKMDKCIERVIPGAYRVNCVDLTEKGPFVKIFRYLSFVFLNPDLANMSYKKQSEITDLTIDEIQVVWGYISNVWGYTQEK